MNPVVLDTSALTAHFFQERGCEIVRDILSDRSRCIAICAITLFEFHFALKAKDVNKQDALDAIKMYEGLISEIIPVDFKSVQAAIKIRDASYVRIPAIDAIIAGCAISNKGTLVHRDSHLDLIPSTMLKTIRL